MVYKARRERKRGGGVKAKVQEYNAQGSNEMRESSDHSDGFREGGKVEGKEARKHMGKRSRSGYSEAHETTPPYGIEPRLFARGGANVPCDDDEQQEAKRGGGIHIKKSHEGLLHKEMGIAQGKPISTSALEKEKKGASPAEKKRIVFAENARHWHHGG